MIGSNVFNILMILGIAVVYAVMNNSADYLMEDFEELNQQYAASADTVVSAVRLTDINQP